MENKLKYSILAMGIVVLLLSAAAVVFYKTQTSLTLLGEEKASIGLCGVYKDPGVKAVFAGRDRTEQVKVEGKVNTEIPGEYTLIYRYLMMEVERTVTVTDKMSPEIILEESTPYVPVFLGEEYVDPGYCAYNSFGLDITDDVKVTGTDFKKAGKQKVTYTVTDYKGNTTQLTRMVMVEPNTDYSTPGLPICMYHYVFDEDDPPDDLQEKYRNYITVDALEEELEWLKAEDYYFPTWEEVRAYIDGELILPEKSIVLCFDDGARSFLENGIPVLEKYEVPATCFLITSAEGKQKVKEFKSDYVTYQSHSHNMHRAGGKIGHGGIFTAISIEEGLEDLQTSIGICGNGDAFAYPFGDYNESSRSMVEEAGFLCGVTTAYGKAYPGDDPMLLPRIRMNMGQTLEQFQGMVAPPSYD